MQRDPVLDLLRSVAIVHVVLFHVLHGIVRFVPEPDLASVLDHYPFWMNFTWQPFGVDIIFMVSAYLLTLGLLRDIAAKGRLDLRAYYVRRVSRIIPLYYIAIIVFALVQKEALIDVIMAFGFVQFLITGKAVVPVGWSMEVMMLVYICLPAVVMALFHSKWPMLWISLAILLSLAVRFAALAAQPEEAVVLFTHLLDRGDVLPLAEDLYFRPWFRLTPFLLGIALAIYMTGQPQARRSLFLRSMLYGAAAVLIYVALFLPIHDPTSWIYATTSAAFWVGYWAVNGAAFAIAGCLFIIASQGSAPKIAGPWAMISRNIMGIYLFHMPLILVGAVVVFRSTVPEALSLTTVWHVWGIFAVALALSMGLSALLTRYIEAPIQIAFRRKMGL